MKLFRILAIIAMTQAAIGNVTVMNNVQDIDFRGTCEQVSSFSMRVDQDDFYEASVSTPVFIRIRLGQGVSLAHTLVDHDSAATTHEPIFLAMRLVRSADDPTVTFLADPDTVSIVRWKEGEDQVWLRIQTSSSGWIMVDSTPQAPTTDFAVSWTFGITAAMSARENQAAFAIGDANRAANARNASAVPVELDHVSTLVCVDASQSTLSPFPAIDSMAMYEIIPFDFQTTGVLTASHASQIVTGDITSANLRINESGFWFGYVHPIGVAHERSISTVASDPMPTSQFLCPPNPTETLAYLSNAVVISVSSDVSWHSGSYVVLETPLNDPYGFPTTTPFSLPSGETGYLVDGTMFETPGFPSPGIARAFDTDGFIITPAGDRLARRVVLTYDAPGQRLSHFDLLVRTAVAMPICDPPRSVTVSGTVHVASKEPPMDGSGGAFHQTRLYCDPSFISSETSNWVLGTFEPFFFGNLDQWPDPLRVTDFIQWANQTAGLED